MSEKYDIKVNGTYHFALQKSDLETFDSIHLDDRKVHVLHQNQSYKAEISSSHFLAKKYAVKINNALYEIVIHDELDILIAEMGFEVGAGKQINSVHAPMPGLILEINVAVGQQVSVNDPLLILGAMKMENSFVSPREGIIKSIAVAKGDAVDKGQLLIEFE